MPAQYGISDILRLSGTDFDNSKAIMKRVSGSTLVDSLKEG
jgi:hypothetical protein